MVDNRIYSSITEGNKNFHLIRLDMELDNLENLISFTKRKPENENHLEFIEEYKKITETHKTNISQSFEILKNISSDLTVFINKNIDSIFTKEGFSLGGRNFYFSYYFSSCSYTFFTPLFKDEYNDKNAYGLITYKYKNSEFKLDEISIGYNNNPIDALCDCPKEILENINTMDSASSIDEILYIFNKNENDISKIFPRSHIREIYESKDESFKKIFGVEPIKIIQNNNVKKDENIIRLQLEKHVDNLSSELIELIKTEHTILWLEKNNFDNDLLKDFMPTKEMLLKKNKINQEELDKLMSYINLELLN